MGAYLVGVNNQYENWRLQISAQSNMHIKVKHLKTSRFDNGTQCVGKYPKRKILKLVKYNALPAFRTGFNQAASTVREDDNK